MKEDIPHIRGFSQSVPDSIDGGVFANNDIDMPTWFNRGYTGHACPEFGRREHLKEFDLINMNGRLYDPIPGRMLSADNHVQAPGASQSYNRYSYAFNNPLKYTDPDGEITILAALGIAAAVAGVSYLVGAASNGWEWNPSNWTSGHSVGFGVNTNTAGNTSVYGFGGAGGLSWTGGAAIGNGGFGGGLSSFGQASYNQMPSAGTGSINMQGVERAYQHEYGFWDNSFNKIPELSFEIPAPTLEGELSTAYLAYGGRGGGGPGDGDNDLGKAALGLGLSTTSLLYFDKKGNTWMGKDFSIRSQNWGGNGATGGKFKFAQKVSRGFTGLGYGLGLYNAYQVNEQHNAGEISDFQMTIEQASNVISTLGGIQGGAWGIGWALGRKVVNSNWYQRTIHDRYIPEPYNCIMCPK